MNSETAPFARLFIGGIVGRFRNVSIFAESCCLVFSLTFLALVILVLAACESNTDKLKRTFERKVKQLESEIVVATQTYGEQRLLKPLADKFGEQNCRSIAVYLDREPRSLQRQPNNLLLPYRAELIGTVTVLPCGHKIYIPDYWTGMFANEKAEWFSVMDGDSLLPLIRNQIELTQRTEQVSAQPPITRMATSHTPRDSGEEVAPRAVQQFSPTRVVMPLFNFQYFDEQDFAFSDGRLSIRHFHDEKDLADRDIFSKRDRDYMEHRACKALVAESHDLSGYELDVSLLLIAFRLLGDHLTPIIKYRLSDDDDLCGRLEETEMHIRLNGYLYETYSVQDFPRIDAVYMMLWHTEHSSVRLKNAYFFLYRAFNSFHWIDSLLFQMCALEAIFSNDMKRAATKTICRRVTTLLADPTVWNEKTVGVLYDVRSRISHGDIEANHDPIDNLRLLERMERLTKLCFRRLIALDALKRLATIASRDALMKELDGGSVHLCVS